MKGNVTINAKLVITIPAKAPRRHWAKPVQVIPNKKKAAQKKACRNW
jgi:hypothetical protein